MKNKICVDTDAKMQDVLNKCLSSNLIAFDTETTGLKRFDYVLGVSLGWNLNDSCYISLKHFPQFKEHVKSILEGQIKKVGHHLKFDIKMLERIGIHPTNCAYDTIIMYYLIDSSKKNKLKVLAEKYLNVERKEFDELFPDGLRDLPLEDYWEYACDDANDTYCLLPIFANMIKKLDLINLYKDIELPAMFVFKDLEERGINIDVPHFEKLNNKFVQLLDVNSKQIQDEIGGINKELLPFNPNSTNQKVALFKELGIKTSKKTKKKKGISADNSVISDLITKGNIFALIRMNSFYTKWKGFLTTKKKNSESAFLLNHIEGILYPSINQTQTDTGRLSYSQPNVQQVPARISLDVQNIGTEVAVKDFRMGFIPKKGWVMGVADYSQAELRWLGIYSKDTRIITTYKKDDADIHADTARKLFGVLEPTKLQRTIAKNINFAVIYGASKWKVAKMAGIISEEAGEHIKKYFLMYIGVSQLVQRIKRFTNNYGYITNCFGRRRTFTEKGGIWGQVETNKYHRIMRQAVNFVIQSSVGDLIKLAMIEIHKEFQGKDATLLAQIHDELIFEASPECIDWAVSIVRDKMENVRKYIIKMPVDIKTGENWGAK